MKKEIEREVYYSIRMISGKMIRISGKDYLRISNDIKTGLVNWIQVESEDGPLINARNIEVIEK